MYSRFTSMLLCCFLAVVSVVYAAPLSANVRLDGVNDALGKRSYCYRDNLFRSIYNLKQFAPLACAGYLPETGGSETVTTTVTPQAVTMRTTVTSTATVGTTTTIAGSTDTTSTTTTVYGTATVTVWQFKRNKERRDNTLEAAMSSACSCVVSPTAARAETVTTTVAAPTSTSTVVQRTTKYVATTKTAAAATVTNTSTVSSMTTVTVYAWVTGPPSV
ncbi:hypothetical protein Dda_5273 [Drechslerella dactyloides]|uniref:Uncharacterized protein n=1 Tax=Drechslerella dactyloides TaxID=74499 RepID=A0AAD6IXZ6_DREDA|nr:hypothetical protein Dda_5273 [Drechslerella dactyloides]